MSIIIKGGTIVTPTRSYLSDIKIKDEIIIEIEQNLVDSESEIIDATGCLLFPGFIDSHTHFDLDTGYTRTADDFKTGTAAAIIGGTTSILDFATQNKGETLNEALKNWHDKAKNVSSCDYGFHMAITEWNEDIKKELESMTNEGITSYKAYMAYDSLRLNDGDIYTILKALKKYNGILGVHCENGDLVNTFIKEQLKEGNTSPSAHPLSRPNKVESEAISRYINIASLAESPINIVHLSTKEGIEEVIKAREAGQKVYVETCPQYLLLDDSLYVNEDFEGAKYVLSPPLRKKEDIEMLWQALSKGYIDTIGTDHCSFNLEGQKTHGINDFSKIPNGIPGVEHRPVLIYEYGVNRGRITKEQMCGLLSENVAKLFGMFPKKGVLQVGSDADIVIWDTKKQGIISKDNQKQNVDYTPYEGFKTTGKAKHVFLRGSQVVKEGSIINSNSGKYIKRGETNV
ncbi:dihydropyrimidinase [Clostridium grantii]|uniref:Dihydropyrimidinase n=1 Tax=Clostridium grantii DSM 8605 TaxID=1121316 RepID=A0A1M5QZJ9_9CLOT|nr:dihydropyrimidinase [Clostridium grantii]SHH19230.1 dihydropyrimidinase [Clostridium grantii DSM 8605]